MANSANKSSTGKTIIFRVLIAIVVLFLLAVGASTYYIDYKKSKVVLPPSVGSVSVIEVDTRNYVGNLNTSGFVKSNQTGSLYILGAGKVQKINAAPGQTVTKGQVIIQLDTSAEEASLAAQKANLNSLRLNYEGLKAVAAQGGASKIQVEQARASYTQLLNTVKSVEENIANKKIIAPFDGTIGTVNVSVGDVVSSGSQLASIVPSNTDNASAYVNISVSPTDLGTLAVGNKAKAFDSNGNLLDEGTVSSIDPTISKVNGQAKARIDFNSPKNLADGQFIKIEVATNELTDQIVIPVVAINYSLYGQTVYRLTKLNDADKAKLGMLTAGKSAEEAAKVLDSIWKVQEVVIDSKNRINNVALVNGGLQASDIIVTQYSGNLTDGSFVRIVPGYGLTIPDTFKLPAQAQPKSNSANK